MVSENQPDWLPSDWIEVRDNSGRKVKYYRNTETGQTFYSKEDVMRYINMGNVSRSPPQPVGEDNEEGNELYADTHPTSILVKSIKIPEWLPRGWTMELRTRDNGMQYKCFIHPASGRRFYSKQQVSRYLETINSSSATENSPEVDCQTGEKSSPEHDASQGNGIPDWLPEGWVMELKIRGSGKKEGSKYKCFVDPESGRKFFSKPQVFDYLRTLDGKAARQKKRADQLTGDKSSSEPGASEDCKSVDIERGISKQKKGGINRHSMEKHKVTERVSADGLPTGWILEIKTRKSGKKDPYYIDPSSGYEFRSKVDALRYLETGDIERCAIRPKRQDINDSSPIKEDINDTEFINEDISVIERGSDEGLPPGWIREVRTKKSRNGMRRDPYYIDPLSGYEFRSKVDALRYLETGDIERCAIRPKRRDIYDTAPIKEDINDTESINEDNSVIERGSVEGLPPGWIREVRTKKSRNGMRRDPYYIDPLSGYEFRSKVDALRYLETGDIERCAIRPKRQDIYDTSPIKEDMNDTESINEDISVIERGSVEGLPPGWIREVRTKKSRNGMRRDLYFIDPLSGYEFRSKPDALRYLETGNIKRCAIRPKRRNINGLESINEDISPVSAVDGQELMQGPIRRQLFPGKGSSDTGSLAAPEAESSKEKQDHSVSVEAIVASEKPPNGSATEKCSRTEGSSNPDAKASLAENGCVSTPATDILQEAKLSENGTVENNSRQIRTRSNKSKNKTAEPLLPGRSSKRLKGVEPEMKVDPLFNERAIRAAVCRVPKLEADPERETNKGEKHAEDQAVHEGLPQRESADKPNGEKTEGAIPVEDNLVIHGVSQQPGT